MLKGTRSAAKNQRAHQRNMARRAENIRLQKEAVDERLTRNGKLSQEDQNFLKKHFGTKIETKTKTENAEPKAKTKKPKKAKPAPKAEKNGNLAATLAAAGVK